MSNKSSHANHTPERRCVICKQIKRINELDRIIFLNNQIIIDLNRSVFSYGYYICKDSDCFEKLLSKKIKKNRIKELKV